MCSEEAEEYVDIGALNGLFVLGRSMGFIGESHLYHLHIASRAIQQNPSLGAPELRTPL